MRILLAGATRACGAASLASGRGEIALAGSIHAKSSAKYSSALRTGSGVSPPIAHSEPWRIVSHRSFSSAKFLSRSRRESLGSLLGLHSRVSSNRR